MVQELFPAANISIRDEATKTEEDFASTRESMLISQYSVLGSLTLQTNGSTLFVTTSTTAQ
jgi:hypothetical protein